MNKSKIDSCKEDLTDMIEKYSLNILLVCLHSLFVELKDKKMTKQRRALIVLDQNKWHLWQYLCEEEKSQTKDIAA
jgi:hypothetical protein